jgi:NitT/TauT family transport system permease protein
MNPNLPTTSIGVRRSGVWDFALLPLILLLLVLLAYGAQGMSDPYEVGTPIPISTDPAELPYYLLRTTLRMFIALAFSVFFSYAFAILVTRSRAAEKILVPTLDILQSIPILGFLSITVTGFIALFPGSLLGVECAAIFAIFTSQAWNMAFSAYQSFKTIPPELDEASRVFRQSAWQRFWRLEVPFSMPGMLWNMMMSMSGGWFFVVASEAITVANHDITLPGVGSYIATAIDAKDLPAIGWAILAMLVAIIIYDQLFFRPLVVWAERFKFQEQDSEVVAKSWLWGLIRKTRWIQALGMFLTRLFEGSIRFFTLKRDGTVSAPQPILPARHSDRLWDVLILGLMLVSAWQLVVFVHTEVGLDEFLHVLLLACYTLIRVCVLMLIAIAIWLPIGIWIGLNPAIAARAQAIAQFLAAFPANLVFPLAVIGILHFNLDPNIWLSPLIIFGTQWYILFNVIAGASTIPADLRYASDNLGLKGFLKWRRYYIPAVFPSLITGALTAMGGSWNASIVAEYVSWGDKTLKADGLGEYIARMTAEGDFPRIALGIGMMCVFVMVFNRFVWRKLYERAGRGLNF